MLRLIVVLLVVCMSQVALAEPSAPGLAALSASEPQDPPDVPPRKDTLVFHPCSQCHEYWKTDATPRELAPVHEVGLKHGNGQLWCLVCHDPDDRNSLHSVRGGKVDFDAAWKLCGQCHSARQKDWYFGAHGKRVQNWQGEPERYNCTHCHNPHRPPFVLRKAKPPPPVRAGLEPMAGGGGHRVAPWNRPIVKTNEESTHE